MEKKYYYIKYKNMYLKSISTYEVYAINNFISQIEFSMSKTYCNSYRMQNAELIMIKLNEIGFASDNMHLEEIINEEEE